MQKTLLLFSLFGFILWSTASIFPIARGLGKRHAFTFSTAGLVGAWVCATALVINMLVSGQALQTQICQIWQWVAFSNVEISFDLLVDSLTVSMGWLVISIALIVYVYAYNYLASDPHWPRFGFFLLIFTLFMLILVFAANFVVMFVGWEGVGITSYLLINFWYTRLQANKAALKALVVNKIGDVAIMIAMALVYTFFGTLDYLTVFALVPQVEGANFLFWICFFLLVGAVGKSAQFGLHVWLPDAMEGPTPVSALLHAATMVTAGIFLIIRCNILFESASSVLTIMLWIGALTAFFGASVACFQHDIKRIIAFSTCSHLGFMLTTCALSHYHVAFFHLCNHAFFKALLFLAAGSVIHALRDEQDIRRMGNLIGKLPLTCSFFVIANLAGSGFPYLSGFYSKDLILELHYLFTNQFSVFGLLLCASFCSAFYSFRLVYCVFFSGQKHSMFLHNQVQEPLWYVQIPLAILAILSIVSGGFLGDTFMSLDTAFEILIKHLQVTSHVSVVLVDLEFLPSWFRWIPWGALLLGYFCVPLHFRIQRWLVFNAIRYPIGFKIYREIYSFFNQRWYIDLIYNKVITLLLQSSFYFYKKIDKGLLELIGPSGSRKFLMFIYQKLILPFHNGQIRFYLMVIIISFIVIILAIFVY